MIDISEKAEVLKTFGNLREHLQLHLFKSTVGCSETLSVFGKLKNFVRRIVTYTKFHSSEV